MIRQLLIAILMCTAITSAAQKDSTVYVVAKADTLLNTLENIPTKYLNNINTKLDKYTSRVSGKTEKTLTKLAKWETKIKSLLEKASPETAQRLFNNNQLTFSAALAKYKQGEALFNEQRAKYNAYRDKLTTSIKYLEAQKENLDSKLIKPLQKATKQVQDYETVQDNTDQMEQFIKDRRRELINQSLQFIGKSKYLQKIDKEAYYYVETIRNYKQIFSNKQKAEQTTLNILNKIPAFKKFMQENSMLASMFSLGGNIPNASGQIMGLQTRVSINSAMQQQIAAGGPNAMTQIRQNMQQVQSEISKLKQKISASDGGDSDYEMPGFKANTQKAKRFLQRVEYSTNFQFSKTNNYLPTAADIALGAGYKPNDKVIIGIGVSYKAGLGTIQRIAITHQGVGLRSSLEWKLKKKLYLASGYEQNYLSQFKNINQLKAFSSWQTSGLIGLSKKIEVRTKFFKGINTQVLYDFLYRNHTPVSVPFLFRLGYSFK